MNGQKNVVLLMCQKGQCGALRTNLTIAQATVVRRQHEHKEGEGEGVPEGEELTENHSLIVASLDPLANDNPVINVKESSAQVYLFPAGERKPQYVRYTGNGFVGDLVEFIERERHNAPRTEQEPVGQQSESSTESVEREEDGKRARDEL